MAQKLVYTVYFTAGKGSDLWGQYTSKRESDAAVRHLMNDETVTLVTVDVSRSA